MTHHNFSPVYLIQEALSSLRRHSIKEAATVIPFQMTRVALVKFTSELSPDLLYSLNGRLERGAALVEQGAVTPCNDPSQPHKKRLYRVRSASQWGLSYLVDLDAQTCECPDHWKGHFCKHRIASHITELALYAMSVDNPPPVTIREPEPVVQKISPPPAPVPLPVTAPLVPKVEQPARENKPPQTKESVVWAMIKHQGQVLGVEVVDIAGEVARVRALPKVVDGKKLLPQFPFPGKSCFITLPKNELFHVRIFQ